MIYDKVRLNKGKAYNERTGKFTASIEGVYSFRRAICSHIGRHFVTEIVHNGNPKVINYCDGRGRNEGYVMKSSQVNIKMKKGDKVRVRTEAIMAFTLVWDIVAFFQDFRSERKKKTITYFKIFKFDFRPLLKVLRQL